MMTWECIPLRSRGQWDQIVIRIFVRVFATQRNMLIRTILLNRGDTIDELVCLGLWPNLPYLDNLAV